MISIRKEMLCGLALAGLLSASGCGKPVHALGHGASAEPTVTVLLSDAASAAGETTTAAASVTVAGYGTFKGRVVVTGAVSPLQPLLGKGAPTKDAICAAIEIPDESVVVGPNNGLANVFVYLKKVPGGEIPPPPTEPGVIDQQGCRFLPHAAVFRVNQTLLFKNADPVAHNTSFSPQSSGKFNQAVSPNDRSGIAYQYAKAETVPVRAQCDFHSWMGSYHLPLTHPWAAVTAADGSFEIKGVPGTTVEFVIWHEKAQYLNRGLKVTIPVDGVIEQEVTVEAAKLAAK